MGDRFKGEVHGGVPGQAWVEDTEGSSMTPRRLSWPEANERLLSAPYLPQSTLVDVRLLNLPETFFEPSLEPRVEPP